MGMADWSSLPSDLANRIADCFHATNDLDWYMDFRAVCHSWRSATADPTAAGLAEEHRFRPRCWVMLEEDKTHYSHSCDDGTRLFVNTATGRFLRRRLQHVLTGYYLVSTTTGGFLVLADRNPPHAALVLNPFTGSTTRFVASVPCSPSLTAAVVSSSHGSAAVTLVLASDLPSHAVYWADPESEAFSYATCHRRPPALLPYLAARLHAGGSPATTDKIIKTVDLDLLWPPADDLEHRTFAIGAGESEEMLFVDLMESSHSVQVHKMAAEEGAAVLEQQVVSLGLGRSHSFFVGDHRCLLVDADKFPTIEANCVYYQLEVPDELSCHGIFRCDLKSGKAERIAVAASINPLPFLMPDDHPRSLAHSAPRQIHHARSI
ncbi:hypothetical protein BS78_03G412000 [Paspalum vaginatum]|nr:hypothetical protein BS78_03G412000 [Paspalum vaginatum]